MKRYIVATKMNIESAKPSKSGEYTNYAVVSYGDKLNRYAVHSTDTYDEDDSLSTFNMFKAQITKISPYDDAQYVWAKMEKGTVKYIQNGKVIDKSYYMTSDDYDETNTEWVSDIVEDVVAELTKLNKSIKSQIIHN